jgi:hypothetical protein
VWIVASGMALCVSGLVVDFLCHVTHVACPLSSLVGTIVSSRNFYALLSLLRSVVPLVVSSGRNLLGFFQKVEMSRAKYFANLGPSGCTLHNHSCSVRGRRRS